jgi:4-hydroxy-tetrahydrodipicolinate synthase
MSPSWDGVYCALWTPTDGNGDLLESALVSNLELLKRSGVQGLLPLGSTGEFLHLDIPLRRRIIEKLVRWAGPLKLMVNVSEIRPAVVASLAEHAGQCGAAAVSVLPPYFYPVAQEDITEFFVRTAEAARVPLFLYNFPERTGNRIAIETIAAVADRVPVAGVKQSGAEFDYHKELVQLGREKSFVVLTGSDTRLPEAVAYGVSGCVSGLSNAVPELVLQALAESRRAPGANKRIAAERMAEIGRRIPAVKFPLDVAALMEARGLLTGSFKCIVSPASQARYRQLVAELKELLQEWQLV